MSNDNTSYIQRMISDFVVPGNDALVECILGTAHEPHPKWDSAIVFSTEQRKQFYSDIFEFWTRALFVFAEDLRVGPLFANVRRVIECRSISPAEFEERYLALLRNKVKDESFMERQQYPETYVELEKRSFSAAFMIVAQADFESAVAASDGEYLAYFRFIHPASHSVVFPISPVGMEPLP